MRYFSGTFPKGNTHCKALDRLTIHVATAVGSVVLVFAFLAPEALADRYSYPLGDISHAELLDRHEVFRRNYDEYETPAPVEGLPADLAVQILFGTWCHDSEREVPRMLKLLEASGVKQEKISLIALDIRKEEPQGRAKALGVKYTPTFIFLSRNQELGRIIERPSISLSDDVAAIAALAR
jgi:thiol-disulfide isomerase/thioredoxin